VPGLTPERNSLDFIECNVVLAQQLWALNFVHSPAARAWWIMALTFACRSGVRPVSWPWRSVGKKRRDWFTGEA